MKIERVLVVHKKSLYEIYITEHHDVDVEKALSQGDPVAQQFVDSHDVQKRSLDQVSTTLSRLGLDVVTTWRGNLHAIKNCDLVIAVGGDGTVLDTSHKINNGTPLLGINSHAATSAGALCAATAEQTEEVIEALIEGTLQPISATRLRTRVKNREALSPCLNDVLLAHSSPAEITRLELQLRRANGDIDTLHPQQGKLIRSSGLWVATATGSTGALFSAGGKSLPPDSSDLQYWVREPNLRQERKRKPLTGYFVGDDVLEVINRTRRAMLWGDGAHNKFRLRYGESILFDVHPTPLNIVRRSYR